MSLIVRNRAYVFEMSNQSYGEDQIRTKEGRAGIYMKKDAIGSSRSSEWLNDEQDANISAVFDQPAVAGSSKEFSFQISQRRIIIVIYQCILGHAI